MKVEDKIKLLNLKRIRCYCGQYLCHSNGSHTLVKCGGCKSQVLLEMDSKTSKIISLTIIEEGR